MKKNTYLTILTVVTVLCIIVGSILHLGLFSFHLPFSDISLGSESIGSMKKEAQAVSDFSAIEIDANVLAVTVEAGDSFKVEMDCNEKLLPSVDVKDKKLIIKQKLNHKRFNSSTHAEMTITVPAGADLDSISVLQNVGDFQLKNVDVANANITVNVGDIEIENASGEQLTVDSNTGDVEVSNCAFQTVKLDSDIGDADYSSSVSLANYSMDLKTDVGDVDVNGIEHDANHHGTKHEYSQSGSAGSLTIQVDVGSICVK